MAQANAGVDIKMHREKAHRNDLYQTVDGKPLEFGSLVAVIDVAIVAETADSRLNGNNIVDYVEAQIQQVQHSRTQGESDGVAGLRERFLRGSSDHF